MICQLPSFLPLSELRSLHLVRSTHLRFKVNLTLIVIIDSSDYYFSIYEMSKQLVKKKLA